MSGRHPERVEKLLAGAGPGAVALFGLVRTLLDELELVAPWSLLYAPPADGSEVSRRLTGLLATIEQVPQWVAAELGDLTATVSDAERQAIAEAEFYFTTLHQMTEVDQERLRTALARWADGGEPSRAETDYLCELGADLKGKYTSATMSAAAALVGEGRGPSVELEVQLFAEKAEEAERNRRLLGALERAARAHRAVVGSFAWRGVLGSWRRRQPVDRYALGDLVSLRAHLLNLLTVANRRALYSGDYQFLRSRETLLGERLRELEELHIRSLELSPETHGDVSEILYRRLEELLLAVAALLDNEVLRDAIGSESLAELRAGRAPASAPGEARLVGLVRLVAEEDLKTFLELLVGAVRKRASIAHGAGAPVPPVAAAAEAAPPGRLAAAVRFDPRIGRAFAERLVASLARLTAESSPRWRAFRMVYKLQARLGTLPSALLVEIGPFLAELEGDLLPILDEAGAADAVPPTALATLKSCTTRLRAHDVSRPDAAREMSGDLARVARLLDSLRAAAEALKPAG